MIKIELTQEELSALVGLLDAGVKTVGLRAAKEAAVLVDKLEAAAQAAQAESNVVQMPEKADEEDAA